MKKRSSKEVLGFVVAATPVIGIVSTIVCSILNILFFEGANKLMDLIAIMGVMTFMAPFFLAQFFGPAGLLNHLGFQTDLPLWSKVIMFYLILFPVANIIMLAAADSAFHLLPNFHEAMAQGSTKEVVQAMRRESTHQAWAIIGITYVSMLVAGLVFKAIFAKKAKAEVA